MSVEIHELDSAPIICFNINPAVELTCAVESLDVGGVNRTSGFMPSASGKASNVARTIKNLGFEAYMIGPLAGKNGQAFIELLASEKLAGNWVWASGETRTNVSIVENSTQLDTVINGGGLVLNSGDWKQLEDMLLKNCAGGAPVCISGSIPDGVQLPHLTELVVKLSGGGSPVFVDASGDALEAQLRGKPWCAKFNQSEAEGLLNRPLPSLADVVAAALELVDRVEGLLLITMGAAGVVLVDQDRSPIHLVPPRIETVSAVGSGDTFLGALVVGLYRLGKSAAEATAFAVAAGAVNATQMTQGAVSLAQILEILPQVKINPINPQALGA